jgi:uncharacterized RmlC-like cupin family protein
MMAGSEQPNVGRVVRPGDAYAGKQGLDYTPGVSAQTVQSQGLWLGSVVIPPGGRTKAHVHDHHESASYMISGDEAELWSGDDLSDKATAHPGDYLYIPAGVPHVAVNRSPTTPAMAVDARAPTRTNKKASSCAPTLTPQCPNRSPHVRPHRSKPGVASPHRASPRKVH